MKCFKCDKTLERAFKDEDTQPWGATSFFSHGQYGSTVFDPMDESYLGVYICDECLVDNAQKVVEWKPARDVFVSSPTNGEWTPPFKSSSEWRRAYPTKEDNAEEAQP